MPPTPAAPSHRRWWVDRHGPPGEVLHLTTGPVPAPGPGQCLVKVAAAGVNFADGLACEGTYQDGVAPPYTPGIDVAGTVVGGDLPPGVVAGGRVVGTVVAPHGSWADHAVATTTDVYPVPDAVDDVTAVAAHVVFQTAWVALHHRARIRAGDTVVVQAAAGSTGSAAVQVARAAGARVVAVAGGAAKVAAAVAAGADVGLDHRTDDVVAAVRDLTQGAGADIAYDPVGGATLETSRRCLGFDGRLVIVGFASGGPPPTLAANHLLVRNLDAIGIAWPAYRARRPDVVADAQRAINDGLASGAFTPLVAGVRPLTDAATALADLRAGTTVGKWVLTP
jgi:NADPH:quinone reductase